MARVITLKEARLLKKVLEGRRKGILLYHNDPDGITSAALILRFFSGFEAVPRKGPVMDDVFVRELAEREPQVLVFLDIPADQEREKLLLMKEKGIQIVVVDHHIAEWNLNRDGILHINPRFRKKDAYIPAACVVYKALFLLGFDVKRLSWLACIGIVGDYGFRECGDVMEECRLEYPYLLRGNPLKSRIMEGAKLISSAVTLKGLKGAGEALRIVKQCEHFEDLMASRKLKSWRRTVDEEIRSIVSEFEEKKETRGDVVFFRIETRLNLTSVISTMLSERYPDKIVVIRKRSGKGWKVSVRNQSGRYNVGEIVKRAVKGLGSGGGHEKAAAGIVSGWLKFRKRFLEEVVKN